MARKDKSKTTRLGFCSSDRSVRAASGAPDWWWWLFRGPEWPPCLLAETWDGDANWSIPLGSNLQIKYLLVPEIMERRARDSSDKKVVIAMWHSYSLQQLSHEMSSGKIPLLHEPAQWIRFALFLVALYEAVWTPFPP
jgi:hypothetical protein